METLAFYLNYFLINEKMIECFKALCFLLIMNNFQSTYYLISMYYSTYYKHYNIDLRKTIRLNITSRLSVTKNQPSLVFENFNIILE